MTILRREISRDICSAGHYIGPNTVNSLPNFNPIENILFVLAFLQVPGTGERFVDMVLYFCPALLYRRFRDMNISTNDGPLKVFVYRRKKRRLLVT